MEGLFIFILFWVVLVVIVFLHPSIEKERCLSGRKGRFAKPLYGLKPVPRVRIPPSPPKKNIYRLFVRDVA